MAISGFEVERSHSGLFSRNYERIRMIVESEPSEDNASRLIRELEGIPNWEKDATAVGYYSAYLKKCEAARNSGALRIVEETRIKKGLFYDEVSRTLVIERAGAPVKVAENKHAGVIRDVPQTREEKILRALPPALAKDEKFISALANLGITIENGNAVFGKAIEDREKQKKFEKFLDIFNYPYETPTDKGLVDRYFWVLKGERDGTRFDWIGETPRRLLRMKYIEAIFDRMKSQGYTIVKSTENNRYEVFCINPGKRDETKQTTYSRLIKGEKGDFTQANQEDLDFGITWAVVTGRRDILNKGSTETSIIKGILEANVIKSPSGEKIIDEKTLLIHKDFVLKQINEKMRIDGKGKKSGTKDGTEIPNPGQFAINIQEYQELAFLRDWILGEKYLTPSIINNTTEMINQYRTYKYMTEFVGSKLGDMTSNPQEFGTQLQNLAGALTVPAIAVILFAWLTGNGKAALGGAAALFGLYAGGEVLNRTGLGAKVNEVLGVLRISDEKNVNPLTSGGLEAPTRVSEEYKKSLSLLASINSKNKTKADTGTLAPYVKNNFIIGKVFYEIEKSGKNWPLKDVGTAEQIWQSISSRATISGSEFSEVPADIKGTKISKKDVENIIEMMKDTTFLGTKSTPPRTILDAMSEAGKDIASSTYNQFFEKSLSITGNPDFDTALNEELRKRFDGKTTKVKREVIELRTLLNNGLNKDIFVLSNWKNMSTISKMFAGQTAEIARIQSLQDELTQRNFPSDIIDILTNYKKYIDIAGRLNSYEGIFSEQNLTETILTGKQIQILFLNGVEIVSGGSFASKTLEEQKKYYEDLRSGIVASKSQLESIEIDETNDLFKGLTERKTKAISEFDRVIGVIDSKIGETQGKIDALFGTGALGELSDAEKRAIFERLKASPSREIGVVKEKEKVLSTLDFNENISELTGTLKKTIKEIENLIEGYTSGDPSLLSEHGETVITRLQELRDTKIEEIKERLKTKVESYLAANATALTDISSINLTVTSGTTLEAKLSESLTKLAAVKAHIENRNKNTLIDWATPSITVNGFTLPSVPLKIDGPLSTISDSQMITDVESIGITITNKDKTIDEVRRKYQEKLGEINTQLQSQITVLFDITGINDTNSLKQRIGILQSLKSGVSSSSGITLDVSKVESTINAAREKYITLAKISEHRELIPLIADIGQIDQTFKRTFYFPTLNESKTLQEIIIALNILKGRTTPPLSMEEQAKIFSLTEAINKLP